MGRLEDVLKHAQKALEQAPDEPDAWPVHVGLVRGYSAVGRLEDVLKHAQRALEQAPDEPNRENLKRMVADLKPEKPAF